MDPKKKSQDTAIVQAKKEIVDVVADKIRGFQSSGELNFPANYSPENALKSAWLIIQKTMDRNDKLAVEVCTPLSITNALLDTVIQGLSPVKKQVYFIVYGTELQATRSYFGTVAATKRLNGVEDVFAQVIYKGDEFVYTIDRGVKKIIKHEQSIENIDNDNILGAYATVIKDGSEYTEIMSKKQIDVAWAKSKMKTNNVQKEFPEEMAKRTVINRACKMFVNVSDDSDLLIEAYNRSTSAEYDEDTIEGTVEKEVKAKANKETLDIINKSYSIKNTDKTTNIDTTRAMDVEYTEDKPNSPMAEEGDDPY